MARSASRSVPVPGLDQRLPSHGLGQQAVDRVVGIRVEGEDGAEVGPAGLEQVQPVGFGLGEGVLVGENASRVQVFQADRGHEAPQHPPPAAGVPVKDMVRIEGGYRVPQEDAPLQPRAEVPGGPGIAVVPGRVPGADQPQFQPDDVLGMGPVQGPLFLRGDDVVGRRHHPIRIGDAGKIVADTLEGDDDSHATLSLRLRKTGSSTVPARTRNWVEESLICNTTPMGCQRPGTLAGAERPEAARVPRPRSGTGGARRTRGASGLPGLGLGDGFPGTGQTGTEGLDPGG